MSRKITESNFRELVLENGGSNHLANQIVDEMESCYYGPNAIYDCEVTKDELFAILADKIKERGKAVYKDLMSLVLNVPAPYGSHKMRNGARKGENEYALYTGSAEQFKYTIFAKTDEELFSKVEAIVGMSNASFRKLPKKSGYPVGANHYMVGGSGTEILIIGPLDPHLTNLKAS